MATKYNKAWEDAAKYPHFASWIQRANMDSQFRCKLCGGKDLNLGNMGQRALVSHLEGKKHAAIVSTMRSSSRLSLTGTSSFSQPEITIAGPTNTIETEEQVRITSVMERMVVPNQVTEAEIRWALKMVQGHASFKSCNHLSELFGVMFKDSEIATKFKLGPDKARYLICFGLAPFYMDTLIRRFFPCKFTLSFDEAFNKINHQAQLDVHVTFYDFAKRMVVRRYYDSVFLGHTSAVDLSKAMKEGLENINWLSNLSFQTIKKTLANGDFLIARLEFSRTVSCELEPFLRFFQADKPLAVFLHEDLVQMMRAILSIDRFKLLCEKLLELKHITSIQADAALKQFKTLLSVEKFKTALNNFDRKFYAHLCKPQPFYAHLCNYALSRL